MLAVKAREAETMMLISEFNRQVVENVCSSEESNLHVVRCGVDVSSFSPVNRGPIPRAPRLLCVGTLHEVKGQRFLIEAIDCLRQRGIESTLQLIGDGDDFASLAQLARDLGLSNSITFSGALPRAEVLKAYGEADIVVCPSAPSNDGRKEGIPVVLMEAMATGAPVVASRLAGIPELVVDGVTGLLADPASSVSLADRIECLVTDPGLAARLGQQGRLRVEQEFSAPRNAAMVAALIRGHGDPAVGRTLPEAPARQGVI
jgi:glycosyltransferase involved in cell wall biosynthesis